MPKPVKVAKGKEFTFRAATAGQPSKYNWDEWFNGTLLMIERSVMQKDDKGNEIKDDDGKPIVEEKRDYDTDTAMMPGKLKAGARRAYKVVQISRLDADGNRLLDAIILRARDMTAEERTAEDLQRAEEKAARKEKKEVKAMDNNTPDGPQGIADAA